MNFESYYGGENRGYGVLGCDTVQSGRQAPTLPKDLLPSSSALRMNAKIYSGMLASLPIYRTTTLHIPQEYM
jgi:hypothetical protein